MPRAPSPTGRKSLLLLALVSIGIGGAWWWQRPPPDPVNKGTRLSEYISGDAGRTDPRPYREQIQSFGSAGVAWLTYTLEHGRHEFHHQGPLPFDTAPHWLRERLPERWGGTRFDVSDPNTDIPGAMLDERLIAARLLEHFGPRAASAIPALTRSLDDDDDQLIVQAALTLHNIGPASRPAVQDTLAHGSTRARKVLLNTISEYLNPMESYHRTSGHPDEEELRYTAAVLARACDDPDASIREATAVSIDRCHPSQFDSGAFDVVLPPLVQLLHDRDTAVLIESMRALGGFGEKIAPATPRLIELLDDARVHVRSSAAWCLACGDQAGKRAEARLRLMLHDPDEEGRTAAAAALTRLNLMSAEESAGREHSPAQ